MAHCHNDFGMATAWTIASVKGGAECAHVTLDGLGEKTGNADIAEVAIAAKLYGIPVNIDMKKLYPNAKLVEKISGIPISPLRPVVRENVFKRESGVAVAQLISYPPAVEGYSPELLGREREVLLGKKSGKRSVEHKLEMLGLEASPEQVHEILAKVKELAMKKKGLVSEKEFNGIVEGICND
jgi:isopropylmalate/homocitrate/citramalate synthase